MIINKVQLKIKIEFPATLLAQMTSTSYLIISYYFKLNFYLNLMRMPKDSIVSPFKIKLAPSSM